MSVELTTLNSGITVVTDAMPHLETASLGVWVNSGSRDEERDEHGISHFLEHMAFKGTTSRSALQIAKEIIDLIPGTKSQVIHQPMPPDDPRLRCPDISRAKQILNWQPLIQRREGLARMIDFYRDDLKKS